MDKKIAIPLIIISLFGGFGIGKIYEKNIWQEKVSQVVQEELDWAKSQLETNKFFQERLYHISGIVIEKGDEFLVTEGRPQVSQSPLPEGKESEKQNIKVNVDGETEIFRFVMVAESPQKVFLKFEDIKVGDYIFMVSKEEVRGKKEITAEKIQVSSLVE